MDDPSLVVDRRGSADDALEWAATRIAAAIRGSVLDVGCGEGRFLPPDGVGLDLDERALRSAASRASRLVRGDARSLPFTDRSFDTVMANRMLNAAGEIDDVILEAKRVLRPGGRFIVLTLAREPRSLLERLHAEARGDVERRSGEDRIDEDNGELRLRRHFSRVRAERFTRARRFADRSEALDHYARRYLFRRERAPDVAAAMFERVRAAIATVSFDDLTDEEHACLLVAERNG